MPAPNKSHALVTFVCDYMVVNVSVRMDVAGEPAAEHDEDAILEACELLLNKYGMDMGVLAKIESYVEEWV
jgi:hypothetical protein